MTADKRNFTPNLKQSQIASFWITEHRKAICVFWLSVLCFPDQRAFCSVNPLDLPHTVHLTSKASLCPLDVCSSSLFWEGIPSQFIFAIKEPVEFPHIIWPKKIKKKISVMVNFFLFNLYKWWFLIFYWFVVLFFKEERFSAQKWVLSAVRVGFNCAVTIRMP